MKSMIHNIKTRR